MTRGVTLLELLLALVVAGLLLGLTVPRLGPALDRLAAEQAALQIAGAHARARMVSAVEGRVSLLTITPDSLTLQVVDGVDTLTRWTSAGPLKAGVLLAGAGHPLIFAPTGVTIGASNATYQLTRGSAVRQVIVSRYGRVRIQ